MHKKSRRTRGNGEGSIYPNTKGKGFTAAIYNVDKQRISKRLKNRAEAERWLVEQRIAREQGINTRPITNKMKVKDFLGEWIEIKQFHKESTRKNYRDTINNRIIPHIGEQEVGKLRPTAIEAMFVKLKETHSYGSRRLTYQVLNSAFKDACRLKQLNNNPMERVSPPKGVSIPHDIIPDDDFEAIYKAASDSDYLLARLEVGGYMGLRPGEALALTWEDIDWKNGLLHISRQVQATPGVGIEVQSTKTNSARSILLDSDQLRILRNHKISQEQKKIDWKIDKRLIFPNKVGNYLDRKKDVRDFKLLCKKAGVKDYKLYQLRSTAFSRMARFTDLATLRSYSGHSQTSTLLKHYLKSTTESMRSAVTAVSLTRPHTANEKSDRRLRIV